MIAPVNTFNAEQRTKIARIDRHPHGTVRALLAGGVTDYPVYDESR